MIAVGPGGSEEQVMLDRTPDQCPLCHRSMHAKPIYLVRVPGSRLQCVYKCPSQECGRLFIATYGSTGGGVTHPYLSSAPLVPKEVDFPESIVEVSPTFVEIYNQAMYAESQELNQLVGIGMRKALEFLVKDFAAAENPDQAQSIRSKPLGPCINEHLTDPNIRECAKRAVWLGNDETHYVRKWSDRDISDLKVLVRLTANWVDNVLLTKKFIAEMQQGKA